MSKASEFLFGGGSNNGLYGLLDATREAKRKEWERQEAERKKAEDDMTRQERESSRRWGDEAVRGASIGATVSGGNPWGALVGGIIGSAQGSLNDYDYRRKHGEGKWDAAWGTFKDAFTPKYILPNPQEAFMGAAVLGPEIKERTSGPGPSSGKPSSGNAQRLLTDSDAQPPTPPSISVSPALGREAQAYLTPEELEKRRRNQALEHWARLIGNGSLG